MSFNLDEYVDVAERIQSFYERFPDGRLVTSDYGPMMIGDKPFVFCHAKAFRSPDDTLPGDGLAWEPIPGPTQFTRDSELMNAQTAAWGRAIVALGFETKKLASKQEVRARQAVPGPTDETAVARNNGSSDPGDAVVCFGKHKGAKVRDVPRPYWAWWLAQDPPKSRDQQELRANVELFLAGATGDIASEVTGLEDGIRF